VDGVAGGKPRAFEAEAGEEDVGFDDVFQGHGDDAGFAGSLGFE
jgi:hypothetical protein